MHAGGRAPPEKTGVYMGIFNFFIVLPEIAAALCFDKLMGSVLHNSQVAAVMIGGGFLCLAAVLVQFVRETPAAVEQLDRVVEEEGMLPTMTPPESPLGAVVSNIRWHASFFARSRRLA